MRLWSRTERRQGDKVTVTISECAVLHVFGLYWKKFNSETLAIP